MTIMPMYTYDCENCGFHEAALEKIENRDEHICPKCHNKMKRTFDPSSVAIHYLATGFYSTRDWDLMFTPEHVVENKLTDNKDKQEVEDMLDEIEKS